MTETTAANPELLQEQVASLLVQPLEAASVVLSSGPRIFDTASPLRIPKLMSGANRMQGVAQLFHTADNTGQIGDTIVILADPSEAANVLNKAKESLGTSVTGAPQPSSVGSNGTLASGTSSDGSKSVTVLMFTEGKAFATLEFDGAPNNPVPPDFVDLVGQKQLDAIKPDCRTS